MCNQSLYSKYERPVPLQIMVKLAYFYKTSADYLLGLTSVRAPYPR